MKVVQCIPAGEDKIFSGYFIDAVTLTVFSHRNGRVDLVGRTGLPWENLSIKNRPLWHTTHANGRFRFPWARFCSSKTPRSKQ